ncbi:beta-ketoacyl-[acyl-carrier-protein] synthase II [Arenicella chitinivorans]|uniref:Beta-ketoacyl-[acyl-carrier-protein] synthase II n=1 Tax=Arenicella chitinivorans TaxID=1329800 RepID=A0A918RVW6_9GAMM|nr:beta-ketoacyl-ACP synthase [Arenicella chitinivorans]GHA14551.1 beta-ketoacyl-[acyl-carrier-protein] synthase II [Arenicella chitinivorans]
MDIRLLDYQSTSAAGVDIGALRQSIDTQTSGLRKNDMPGSDLTTWIGRVPGVEDINLGDWQSRNNALAHLGYQQGTIATHVENLKSSLGSQRLGIVMGSSTSSIDRTEAAYRHLEDGALSLPYRQPLVHNPHAPSLYMAHLTGITGPALTINTACSSSAKVFATGARWLRAGIVDAVLVGGVDTLCLSVLHGFDSLQLVSPNQCRPLDQHRDGINLGEASGFAILVRAGDGYADSGIRLLGYGESSDAHHMSHPHPDGLGARLAMQQALTRAQLRPEQIDYINLHGTSSRANDLIEGQLIGKLFPKSTQVSSTKAWMGHTLGAAGITEALIAVDALQRGVIPGSLNLAELDHELDLSVQADNITRDMHYVLSNSFGFGGNNCCLVFGSVA